MKYDRLEGYLKDVQATVYTEKGWHVHDEITLASIDKYVAKHQFKKILDIGCGTGFAMKKFKDMGISVTGITLDETELKLHRENGFDVHLMDMSFLEFEDNSFDFIWCRHALEHSIMPYVTLREMHRVLDKDGYVYVEVPSPIPNHVANPNHYSMFDDLGWQELFRKAEFKLLDRGQYVLEVPEPGVMSLWLYWTYWLKK